MKLRWLAYGLAQMAAMLSAAGARAQSDAPQTPSRPEPPAALSLPDACQLMPKSDLERFFPGRPVSSRGPTLSPAHRGRQYAKSCMYLLKLPSDEFKTDVSRFASLMIVQWGVDPEGKNGSIESFAMMASTRRQLAPNPAMDLRFEPLPDLGDEAFAEVSKSTVTIHVREADLVFFVNFDNHSPEIEPVAVAIARQVAGRWRARAQGGAMRSRQG